MKTNLSSTIKVPADFKLSSIDKIAAINEAAQYPIREVYGSLPSLTLSCRPEHILPIPEAKLDVYIKGLADIGVVFNYTWNNKITHDAAPAINSLLTRILSLGIQHITASDNAIVENASNLGFRVTLSVVRAVSKPEDIVDSPVFEMLDKICVIEDLVRNPSRLGYLSEYLSRHVEVEAIVNSMCLIGCPVRKSHYSEIPRQTDWRADKYGLFCDQIRLDSPVEIIKSPWLLPQDLWRLRKLGVSSFKISGRELICDNSYRYLKAYANGFYEGPLLDLLFIGNKNNYSNLSSVHAKDVEGLVERVHKECKECSRAYCNKCGICHEYASNAKLMLDENAEQKFRARLEELHNQC